jgi:hypothetical protein
MQGPKTVQEAIAHFEAAAEPDRADLIRFMADREAFARLVDSLPHAIEAGSAAHAIVLLKMWGSWHGLYPTDRAIQAMLRYGQAMLHGTDTNASPPDSL